MSALLTLLAAILDLFCLISSFIVMPSVEEYKMISCQQLYFKFIDFTLSTPLSEHECPYFPSIKSIKALDYFRENYLDPPPASTEISLKKEQQFVCTPKSYFPIFPPQGLRGTYKKTGQHF